MQVVDCGFQLLTLHPIISFFYFFSLFVCGNYVSFSCLTALYFLMHSFDVVLASVYYILIFDHTLHYACYNQKLFKSVDQRIF